MTEHALAIQGQGQKDAVLPFSMTPRTFEEALKFAELMSQSDLVPKDFKDKPGNILVAIQKGFEVGLSPMAALETIAVINGRASLWGDGLLGIVQSSPAYEWIDESASTDTKGVCTIKRKGEPAYTQTFTLEDAKRAGLLGKPGPWTQYTKRMLQLRARGFALRDKFADALKGLIAAEEALDTVTIQAAVTETPAMTLKEKLKAQIEHHAAEVTMDKATTTPATPPSSEESRVADLAILKADFHQRLDDAKTFKEAAAVRDEMLSSDLSKDEKDGFVVRFKEKFAEKKK